MNSFPDDYKKNMTELLGEDEYRLLEESYSEENVRGLRINPLKNKADDAINLPERFGLEKMPFSETGYYFEKDSEPGRSPYHDAGAYYIQDPGAMIPAHLLISSKLFSFDEGVRVLDLCASPGGKSTQMSAAMKGKGILVCNEIVRQRAEVLSRNIERMGIANAIVVNESPEKLSEYFEGYFDAVIVDAPCSGEGMFRKDPESVSEWSDENVEMCALRQSDILNNAVKMLRKGGALVYSTCTFEKRENEDVVGKLITDHPDMKLYDTSFIKKNIPGVKDGMAPFENALRMWPMYFKGEGQFACLLKKDGSAEGGISLKGKDLPSPLKQINILKDFLKENLSVEASDMILSLKDRFKLFGDNLFILPENAPDVSGLKVLRDGLHIGTFKKDRFEPAHALALLLSEKDVKCVVRVNEEKAEEYVHGMTLEAEASGWCLVSADGYSLGWGKASNGKVKNHYPKGLRVQ